VPTDLDEHAGVLGAHLEVDLLGLELDEGLACRHAIAGPLQPAGHAGLDDRFSELGDDDIGHGQGPAERERGIGIRA
jgi:hypothetical protein